MSAARRSQTAATRNEPQSEPRVEFSAVVRAAACKAGDSAAHAQNARKFLATNWAPINETRHVLSRRKRKIMAALLVGDSQIAASLPPFGSVRQNAVTASTKLRKNMSEFVSQSAIDFSG